MLSARRSTTNAQSYLTWQSLFLRRLKLELGRIRKRTTGPTCAFNCHGTDSDRGFLTLYKLM